MTPNRFAADLVYYAETNVHADVAWLAANQYRPDSFSHSNGLHCPPN